LAAGGPGLEACNYAVNPTVDLVTKLHYPPDWTVVLACDDVAWEHLRLHSGATTNYAFTFFKRKMTIVRGAIFINPMEWEYSPEEVFRHELGHIRCQCQDEWAKRH